MGYRKRICDNTCLITCYDFGKVNIKMFLLFGGVARVRI